MTTEPTTLIVLGTIGALAALLLAGAVETARIIGALQERHPDLYVALGKPSLFINNTISSSMKLMAFVWSKQRVRATDDRVVACANRLRWIHVLYFTFFGIALCLFALSLSGAE
ncbi:MAG TPA: hypothetical protein EYG46_18945 [Myxococcales bacterium]|nr:hypothetical protein [Myxococcales bacterium]HIM03058.1 hypothetical protein [Myxococcales bacterium]